MGGEKNRLGGKKLSKPHITRGGGTTIVVMVSVRAVRLALALVHMAGVIAMAVSLSLYDRRWRAPVYMTYADTTIINGTAVGTSLEATHLLDADLTGMAVAAHAISALMELLVAINYNHNAIGCLPAYTEHLEDGPDLFRAISYAVGSALVLLELAGLSRVAVAGEWAALAAAQVAVIACGAAAEQTQTFQSYSVKSDGLGTSPWAWFGLGCVLETIVLGTVTGTFVRVVRGSADDVPGYVVFFFVVALLLFLAFVAPAVMRLRGVWSPLRASLVSSFIDATCKLSIMAFFAAGAYAQAGHTPAGVYGVLGLVLVMVLVSVVVYRRVDFGAASFHTITG